MKRSASLPQRLDGMPKLVLHEKLILHLSMRVSIFLSNNAFIYSWKKKKNLYKYKAYTKNKVFSSIFTYFGIIVI